MVRFVICDAATSWPAIPSGAPSDWLSDYGDNAWCMFVIDVPPGKQVNISLEFLDLENLYDYLKVYDINLNGYTRHQVEAIQAVMSWTGQLSQQVATTLAIKPAPWSSERSRSSEGYVIKHVPGYLFVEMMTSGLGTVHEFVYFYKESSTCLSCVISAAESLFRS